MIHGDSGTYVDRNGNVFQHDSGGLSHLSADSIVSNENSGTRNSPSDGGGIRDDMANNRGFERSGVLGDERFGGGGFDRGYFGGGFRGGVGGFRGGFRR